MYVHLIYVLWKQLYEKELKELFYEDFHDLLQQKRNRAYSSFTAFIRYEVNVNFLSHYRRRTLVL